MELDLDLQNGRRWLVLAGVALVALALGLLGRWVTPAGTPQPEVLTPERYQIALTAKQARAEVARLNADAAVLAGTLAHQPTDAIQALTLAQRIYAAHRTGTAVTAGARQALTAAAEAVARHAAGGLDRQSAVNALNTALDRLQALQPALPTGETDGSNDAAPTPMAVKGAPGCLGGQCERVNLGAIFLPLVIVG